MGIRIEDRELIHNEAGFCRHPGIKIGVIPQAAIEIPHSSVVIKDEDGKEMVKTSYACGLTRQSGLTAVQKEQIKDGCTGCPNLSIISGEF